MTVSAEGAIKPGNQMVRGITRANICWNIELTIDMGMLMDSVKEAAKTVGSVT